MRAGVTRDLRLEGYLRYEGDRSSFITEWKDHPNRKEICKALGLDENYEYKEVMGPIRYALKKHFLLKIVRKQKWCNTIQKIMYTIDKRTQQELYQLVRNRYREEEVGIRLKEMEDDGTFVVARPSRVESRESRVESRESRVESRESRVESRE